MLGRRKRSIDGFAAIIFYLVWITLIALFVGGSAWLFMAAVNYLAASVFHSDFRINFLQTLAGLFVISFIKGVLFGTGAKASTK